MSLRVSTAPATALLLWLAGTYRPALAQYGRPSLADSFRLGSGGGVLCRVQTNGRDPAIRDIFDRAWAIVCRDVLAVRNGRVAPVIRLRSQILAETALSLEDTGDTAATEDKMRESLAMLETRYPQTIAVIGDGAQAMLTRR